MKKLLLLLSVFVAIAGCKDAEKQQQSEIAKPAVMATTAAQDRLVSLNGIDKKTADAMIADFAKRRGKDTPKSGAFWFSKAMIHDIVEMLDSELADQLAIDPTREDITDGIRIYFASDPNSTSYPLKTSLVILSTIMDGPCTGKACQLKSKHRHRDWYQHAKTALLFNRGVSITGVPCYGGKNCAGAKLYQTLSIPNKPNCPLLPNNLPRDTAEMMVQRFGKDTVNTIAEWFDLTLLKAIDNQKDIDGIRIYFGTNLTSLNYESNRTTFVIATTTFNEETGVSEDNFDCKSNAEILEFYNKKYHTKSMPPLDKGELCPDNCKP